MNMLESNTNIIVMMSGRNAPGLWEVLSFIPTKDSGTRYTVGVATGNFWALLRDCSTCASYSSYILFPTTTVGGQKNIESYTDLIGCRFSHAI